MDAQLALYRSFRKAAAIFAAVPLVPEQRARRGSILGGGTFTVERALKIGDGFLQFWRKTVHHSRVDFENSKEIAGPLLAIAKDRKGVWVISKRLSILVNGTDAGVHTGNDRRILPGIDVKRRGIGQRCGCQLQSRQDDGCRSR